SQFNASHGAAQPSLSAAQTANSIQLSWPGDAPSFQLESRPALGSDTQWQSVSEAPVSINNSFRVLLPLGDSTRFFRLRAVVPPLPSTNFQIGEYELLTSTALPGGLVESTYTAAISNWSSEDADVSAT